MLQIIHEHIKGWVASLIIGLIGLTFALWGIQYYLSADSAETAVVAKVGHQKIRAREVDVLSRQLQRRVSRSGQVLTEGMIQELKQVALENIIATAALGADARRSGFIIGMPEVKQILMEMPSFQDDQHVFSVQKFQQFLNTSDISEMQLLNQFQTDIIITQLRTGITESAFVLPNECKTAYQLLHQQRSFSYIIVPAKRFYSAVHPTEEQLKNHYANNAEQFRSPERISIQYVQLPPGSDAKNEQLESLAFTYPDSLDPIASALKLPVHTSPVFDKQQFIPEPKSILADPRIMEAAFSPEVLRGDNSAPIVLKNGDVVVLRIQQHQKSEVLPFKDAMPAVREQVIRQLAQAKGALLANTLESSFHSGTSLAKLATPYQLAVVTKTALERSAQKQVDPAILDAAFKLRGDISNEKSTTVALDSGDTAVVVLDKITPPLFTGLVTNKKEAEFKSDLQRFDGDIAYQLYVNGVKNSTVIKVY